MAFVWSVEMADGRMILGTEHDEDIELPASGGSPEDKYAGIYYAVANVTMSDVVSNSDLSVDNMEVSGATQAAPTGSPLMGTPLDVNIADIESGNLDNAPVTVMICNWKEPSHGYGIIGTGNLGKITYDSDNNYTTEVRRLTQRLAQTVIRTITDTCNVVRFGDLRCKIDADARAVSGTVLTVPSADAIGISLDIPSDALPRAFNGGELTMTSGLNTGFKRQLKADPLGVSPISALLWEPFPLEVMPGDTFSLRPDCDRTRDACKFYQNIENMRAPGLFVPGVMKMTAGPATTDELGA